MLKIKDKYFCPTAASAQEDEYTYSNLINNQTYVKKEIYKPYSRKLKQLEHFK
jgi:hypothetical protein